MEAPTIRNAISGRNDGLVSLAGQAVARGVVWPYSTFMRLRRWAYNRGILPSQSAGVPVICVGNITTGGTGKTPMVAWVIRKLAEAGMKPAVLTRGYKSVGGKSDEAELLRESTGVQVVVDPDRIAGARTACDAGADVLVMDDGFQHMRLKRDVNVVLIDAMNPFGYGCCLPLGHLREPLSALKDADAIVITRSDAVIPQMKDALSERLSELAPRAPVHLAVHRPVGVIDRDGAQLPADAIAGKKVLVFAGIGNPRAFINTVESLDAEPVGFCIFNDHQKYTPVLLGRLFEKADSCGAELLVTTQKDYVRLAEFELQSPVWQVVVEMDLVKGESELVATVCRAAGRQEPRA